MKRILCVGNGNELLEQVNGRVYRHVYDERSKRYIAIQEDGASAYAVQLRRHGLRVNVEMGRSAALTQALGADTAYVAENALQRDLDATQDAAAGRYGY